MAAEGIAERTFELNPVGGSDTWTKRDYPLTEGLVLQFIVYETPSGNELAAGSCKVSDAVELGYARVMFGPEVMCSCGFEGTTGCSPGN